jgi:hypothetical protein
MKLIGNFLQINSLHLHNSSMRPGLALIPLTTQEMKEKSKFIQDPRDNEAELKSNLVVGQSLAI